MKGRKNSLEWSVFGLSVAIIAALAGFIVLDALRGGSSAPQIDVETGPFVARGERFAVPLTVINRGSRTAEGLRVEIALKNENGDVEVAEVTFAFVPRQSRRHAWAFFTQNPRGLRIEARAIGFAEP